MLDYGFATLADLKLALDVTDTKDDALLAAILDRTAGMIEGAAGRTLRRDHARVEVCNGNSDLLRVNVSPIAKVHSIRESETGDFVTAANYAELVEGTDFFVEGGQGGDSGRPGEPALIRRLGNKNWMGAWAGVAARTRVVYTGGFKTDEEAVIENSSVELSGTTVITDFSVGYNLTGTHSQLNLTDNEMAASDDSAGGAVAVPSRAFVRFDTMQSVLPVWQIVSAIFSHASRRANSGYATAYSIYLLDGAFDPLRISLSSLYSNLVSGEPWPSGGLLLPYGFTASSDNLQIQAPVTDVGEGSSLDTAIGESLLHGHLSFGFNCTTDAILIGTVEHASPAYRPILTVVHRTGVSDVFTVPDDLRNANILQAIHEYQTRKTPGMISQAMRGVSIASGASYMKTRAALLPEVEAVAMHYRRLY